MKQGVKDCQTFENHVGLTDMNPMIECSNRFAVLTVDNNETKSCICTETNVTCTKTDLKHPKGELKVKRSDSFDGPPFSAHSGDKYDLELRFKQKHRDIVTSEKNNKTFKDWDSQTSGKNGFIPLGEPGCQN